MTKITLLLKLKPILSEQKINLLRLDRNAFQETFLEDAKIGLLLQRIFWNEPTRENLLIFTFSIFFSRTFIHSTYFSFILFCLSFCKSFLHSILLKSSNGQNDVWNFQTLRSDSFQKKSGKLHSTLNWTFYEIYNILLNMLQSCCRHKKCPY